MLWQLPVTKTNSSTNSKSLKVGYLVGSSQENSTRVSAKLESYIYKVHMVHTTTLCLPYFLLKATMLYIYTLTSSFRFFHHVLGL